MPTHSQQVVFQLSWWASLSYSVTPEPGQTLEQATFQALQAVLADPPVGSPMHGEPWTLAWGPYVLESDTSHLALNTIYMARSNADPRRYVISVAGTNPKSAFDWLVEDALVGVQIPWIYGILSAPDARISLGTAVGLGILQRGRPQEGIPGAGKTILELLGELPKADGMELIVTGHSLGGALSPTLALWLSDVRTMWDPEKKVAVSTQPSAGPTAGNAAFAAYLDGKLPVERFHNQRDVVPHAWHEADLAKVPLLYAPWIVSTEAFVAAAAAMALSAAGGYTQIHAGAPAFPEAVQRDRIDPNKSSFDNFVSQLAWQHVYAYSDYFGLKDVHSKAVSDALAAETGQPSSGLLRASGKAVTHLPSIPLDGVPTSVPGRHDPALGAFVERVVAVLRESATAEQAGATFPLDGVRIAEPIHHA